jgi:hypothetical protein
MKKTLSVLAVLGFIMCGVQSANAFDWSCTKMNPANWGHCKKCEKPCKVKKSKPCETGYASPCETKNKTKECNPCKKSAETKTTPCNPCQKVKENCDPCDRLQEMGANGDK